MLLGEPELLPKQSILLKAFSYVYIATPATQYIHLTFPAHINYGTIIHNWKKPETSAALRFRKFVNSTLSFFIFLS